MTSPMRLVAVVLVVWWAMGAFVIPIASDLIHALPVIVLALVIHNLLTGKRGGRLESRFHPYRPGPFDDWVPRRCQLSFTMTSGSEGGPGVGRAVRWQGFSAAAVFLALAGFGAVSGLGGFAFVRGESFSYFQL